MSCCGKKREAMQLRRTVSVTPRPASPPTRPRTPLVFHGIGSYLVTGPHSREVYRFSSRQPEQSVDARDAEALLRTGLFQPKR
jgi:hypothetical protein